MLLHSPELMHSGLWRDFYSKGLLFTPDAKENWRLPDVKPLPAIAAVGRQQANSGPRNTDAGEDMLQFALAVIQATFPGKARRGAVIVRALPAFQSAIMRRRASNPNVPPFSETQVYFWIQYFHVAVVSLQENIPSSDSHQAMNTDWSAALSSLTLGTFKTLFGITGQEWKEHYSKAVWESVAARLEYTSPDLKRLPNVIKAPSERNVIEARGEILQSLREKALWGNSDGNDEFPSMVRLSVLVAAVLQEVSLLDDASAVRPVASHAELLRELYRLLVRGRQQPGKKDDVQTGNTTDKTSRDEGTQGGLEAAMRLSGPGMQGVTQRMFWIQQFMSAQRKVGRAEAFAEFLDANPRLAFEGLPLVYYSVELWDSQDAITRFILPDRGTGEHPFY
ncbi:putative ARF-like GTPase [Rosellinia necatrix]|uniref:Putative ARF-like GTPase n=1 Tax=Rosellinia necatrix TaxID=77044 RepID=A0A1S8A8P2_ROSNE|nr:putative ARF-like GTPase [Rosellinia necatrix]